MKTFVTYIAAKSRAIRGMDKCDWALFAHAVSVIVYVVTVIIITIVEVTK